jgi:hypothetical protein
MDAIQPITPRIPDIPAIEPVGQRVDPEQQKREREKRDRERRRDQHAERERSEDDDGLPHIDVSV